MAELSNSVLAALVLATLVIAATGTFVSYVNLPRSSFITGFATTDSGNVSLQVNSTLAIELDAARQAIDFGTCNPRGGTSYWCASNDSVACDNTDLDLGNCTGDTTTAQYLQVNNVGNVNANVTLDSSCDASTLIGGTSPLLQYITSHCNGTNVTSWTSIASATPGQTACANVSYLGGAMRFYVNVTVPFNAIGYNGACSENRTVVTFSATAVG